MDAYITVTSTYNSSTVFWISIVCNIFGIILNSVFVYTSIKINDQKKLVDKTILAVTVVKLCQAFVTIVKSSFKHSLGEADFDISTLNIFDTLDFLLRGLFTWCLLSLTITRMLVLKNVNVLQNPKTRVQISQICMTISITFNFVATITYGIVLFIVSPIHTSQAYTTNRTLKFITNDVPCMFVIILNLVFVVYITVVFFKTDRCRIRKPRQYKYNDKSTHKSNDNVSQRRLPGPSNSQSKVIPRRIHKSCRSASRKLLRQVLMSVILLLIFNIAPCTYVNVLEILVEYLNHNINNQIISYASLSACSTILNPISFGMFSKERRAAIITIVNPAMFSFPLSGLRRPTLIFFRQITFSMVEHHGTRSITRYQKK